MVSDALPPPPADSMLVRLAAPLNLAGTWELFRRHGDDLLDHFDGLVLARALPVNGLLRGVAFEIAGECAAPAVRVHGCGGDHDVAAALMAGQVVAAPLALAALAAADPAVNGLVSRFPGVCAPMFPVVLHALIRSITAQQVTLAWATVLRARLAAAFGDETTVAGRRVRVLDPFRLQRTTVQRLRDLQLSTTKAQAVIAVATAVHEGALRREDLLGCDDDEVIARLAALRGIGPWTAEWFLARTLGRPRVVAGDLGVRKAVGLLYGFQHVPTEREVRVATEHWGPAAVVAQQLALHALALAPARGRTPSVGIPERGEVSPSNDRGLPTSIPRQMVTPPTTGTMRKR